MELRFLIIVLISGTILIEYKKAYFNFKILKFYGWELSFRDIVEKIRNKELDVLKKSNILSSASSFVWTFAPLLVCKQIKSNIKEILIFFLLSIKVSIVSFTAFLLIDKNNKLDARTAFVCLTLFNILR